MTRKIFLITFLSCYSIFLSAQDEKPSAADSVAFNVLDHRFVGGSAAFFKFMGQNIRYPVQARENCREGVSLVRVKLRPTGVVDSIQFQNDVAIGMGVEDEILRCLLGTKGKWLRSLEYPELLFSIGFNLDGTYKPVSTIIVTGYSTPVSRGCSISNEDIIKSFERAKKKKNYKEALELCQDLLRRMPHSETYKKEFASLKTKAN